MQSRIWIGILIGSSIGGFIPELWGADVFSYSSVLLGGIGALVGAVLGILAGIGAVYRRYRGAF